MTVKFFRFTNLLAVETFLRPAITCMSLLAAVQSDSRPLFIRHLTLTVLLPWLAIAITAAISRWRRSITLRFPGDLWFGPLLLMMESPILCSLFFMAGTTVAAIWTTGVHVVWAALVGGCVGAATVLSGPWHRSFHGPWLAALFACAVWLLSQLLGVKLVSGSIWAGMTMNAVAISHYALAFCDRRGEADSDAAVVVGLLGLGLANLDLPPALRAACVLTPVGIYIVYCEKVRGSLNAFKALIRGMHFQDSGDPVAALEQFAVALHFAPLSRVAAAKYWNVHQQIDLASLQSNLRLKELIDPAFCLRRVRRRLAEIEGDQEDPECRHLLDLVQYREPTWRFSVDYCRMRAAVDSGDIDSALLLSAPLRNLTTVETAQLHSLECVELANFWTYILTDPRITANGALNWLDGAGLLRAALAITRGLQVRRSENRRSGIAAEPDPSAHRNSVDHPLSMPLDVMSDLLCFLYRRIDDGAIRALREVEPDAELSWIDVRRLEEIASWHLEQGDDERAMGALQALESLTEGNLAVWKRLAELGEKRAPQSAEAWLNRIRDFGRSRSAAEMTPEQIEIFEWAVRRLASAAERVGNKRSAVEHLELLWTVHRIGLPSLDRMRQLYEEIGDLLSAIRMTESALSHSTPPAEREAWLAHKRRLYLQLNPRCLAEAGAGSLACFDWRHVLDEATAAISCGNAPATQHFLELASFANPSLALEFHSLKGRWLIIQEQPQEAAKCLAAARSAKPDRFHSDKQRKEYYATLRRLADLYLDVLNRPADAIPCLLELERDTSSGAATLFKLGLAFERSGNLEKARKWYDLVLVYPQSDFAEKARSATKRLDASLQQP